jgi:predicted transcriptional regulator
MACRINKLINTTFETLEADVDVQSAAAFMADRDLESVLVSSHGKVIGLFTEKDLVKRVIGPGKDPKSLPLGDVCTRRLISVHEDISCEKAVKTMNSNQCRRLLVYRGDTLKGLVTMPGIARAMASKNSRANALINVFGGVTMLATFVVIGLGLYQLPQMARIAMAVFE